VRGDRVAILGDNGCGWVVGYLGAIGHGAIAVPRSTRHVEGDLGRALDTFDPAAIVGDPPYLRRLSERYRHRVIAAAELGASERRTPTVEGSDARPEEVGVVCSTSGTTGEPRGVMIRNVSLVRSAAMFAQMFQSGPDSTTGGRRTWPTSDVLGWAGRRSARWSRKPVGGAGRPPRPAALRLRSHEERLDLGEQVLRQDFVG
jgi:long-subunit acyl-CoA synthetase (AMP-forming)